MPPLGHRTWWRPRFCLPWDLSSGVSARGTVDGGTSSPKRNVFWFSITLKLLLESRVCCICIEKKRRSMKKKKMLTKIRKLLWLTKVEVCKESGFFFSFSVVRFPVTVLFSCCLSLKTCLVILITCSPLPEHITITGFLLSLPSQHLFLRLFFSLHLRHYSVPPHSPSSHTLPLSLPSISLLVCLTRL